MHASLPVMIVSGFLGSGKTTLVNALLADPRLENTLVLVNELGEVPVDHLLIREVKDTVFEIANGCVCCSVRNDLVETLASVDTRGFDRVLIETTGVATLMPVMQALAAEPSLVERYHLHSVTTVFDSLNGVTQLEAHPEAGYQLAVADNLFITKTDLLDIETTSNSLAYRAHNHHADLFSWDGLDGLIEKYLAPPRIRELDCSDTGHVADHTDAFQTTVLKTPEALDTKSAMQLVEYLAISCGRDLLRLKGTSPIPGQMGKMLIFQISTGVMHPPTEISRKEGVPPGLQLVAITTGGKAKKVRDVFQSFASVPESDLPDREALLQNPLAIPGFPGRNP